MISSIILHKLDIVETLIKNDKLSFFILGMAYLQLVAENNELRRRNKELEEKIFLYLETGMANISRASFRNYVMAELGRKETDAEWRHFISTFSYDISPMNDKIYAWIERYLRKPVLKIVFEEWPTEWD